MQVLLSNVQLMLLAAGTGTRFCSVARIPIQRVSGRNLPGSDRRLHIRDLCDGRLLLQYHQPA